MILRLTKFGVLTFVAYLATMAAATGGIIAARNGVVQTFGTAEAQQQWDAWKHDTQSMPGRKPARAPEPPLLILFRDHFPVMLATGLAVTTMLYGFLALTIRGSLRTRSTSELAHASVEHP